MEAITEVVGADQKKIHHIICTEVRIGIRATGLPRIVYLPPTTLTLKFEWHLKMSCNLTFSEMSATVNVPWGLDLCPEPT